MPVEPWFHQVPASYSRPWLREVHSRLRLFSWVLPYPKEPIGDSLRIAFQVADAAAGIGLLASLGLDHGRALQEPTTGPFAGALLQTEVSRFPLDQHGNPRRDGVVAMVTLWDDLREQRITPHLVELAETVEQRLIADGVDAIPRETRLLSFITPELHPDCWAGGTTEQR